MILRCPHCHNLTESDVIDSRQHPHGHVRRRRICPSCKNRFTTREVAEETYLRRVQDGPAGVQPVESMAQARAIDLTGRPLPDFRQRMRTPPGLDVPAESWTMHDWEKACGKRSGAAKRIISMGYRPKGLQVMDGHWLVPKGTVWPGRGWAKK